MIKDKIVDRLLEDRVFWLGAGFSFAATGGKLRMMPAFLKGLEQSRYPALASFLSANAIDAELANLQDVQRSLDQVADVPGLSPATLSELAGGHPIGAVRSELERIVIERTKFDLQIVRDDNWAHRLMFAADHRTNVVSTNYDTVADQLLSSRPSAIHCTSTSTCHHCNCRGILHGECGDCFQVEMSKSAHGALLKIHGSISWSVCLNPNCRHHQCILPSCDHQAQIGRKCHGCRGDMHSLLILPSHGQRYSRYVELQRMWKRMESSLRICQSITFAGFSFCDSDSTLCRAIAACLKGNRFLQFVNVITPNPEPLITKIKTQNLIPCHVDVRGFVAPSVDVQELPEWAHGLAQSEVDLVEWDPNL